VTISFVAKGIGVVVKKINELMKDLGFNPHGSEAVKEAFIKNLIKASAGINLATPTEKKIIQNSPEKVIQFPKQLAFDFVDDAVQVKPAKIL
jgi:hypothetical protein